MRQELIVKRWGLRGEGDKLKAMSYKFIIKNQEFRAEGEELRAGSLGLRIASIRLRSRCYFDR